MKYSFDDLPSTLQERLLWDMELDYCSYESSKAVTIHDIMTGSTFSSTNQAIVTNYCRAISDETIALYAKQEREAAAKRLVALDDFISRLAHD